MISDKDAIDLIEHLLVLNPKKRYSAKEVLNSNYLEQFKNLNPNINLEDLNHHKDYDNLNNITINSKSFEQKLNDLFDNLLSKMCDLN
jgi:serine/threonine protein kinase